MGKIKTAFLFTISLVCGLVSTTDAQVRLSPTDSLQLYQLHTLCALNDIQGPAIDSLFNHCAKEFAAIDKELSRVSRSDISEEERSRAQAELRNKKKTARDNRDFAAQFLLTPHSARWCPPRLRLRVFRPSSVPPQLSRCVRVIGTLVDLLRVGIMEKTSSKMNS